MKKLKICLFTVARSDLGIMKNIILRAERDPRFDLSLIIGSAHKASVFGKTKKEIEKLNIKKKKFLKFNYKKSSVQNILTYFRNTMKEIQDLFSYYKPDCALILGDRYEMMAIALCCVNFKIPIAHFCGGSETLGSLDNIYRISISKMSKFHFLETNYHKNNLIKNKINDNLYVVGAPALEELELKKKFDSKINLIKKLNLDIDPQKKIITACFHPETTMPTIYNIKNLKIFLQFLLNIKENIIFTYPNADTGFEEYIRLVNDMFRSKVNINLFKNLGIENYYEVLNISSILIGNSSSGIIESASFNLPTINLGDRQKNRFAPKNVFHCPFDEEKIKKKFNELMKIKSKKKIQNPYFKKNCSKNTLDIIYNNFS